MLREKMKQELLVPTVVWALERGVEFFDVVVVATAVPSGLAACSDTLGKGTCLHEQLGFQVEQDS